MRKFTDIYYTDTKLNMQMLDMYLPDTEGFPVFVFFHGGGLEHGDRTHCQCLAGYLPRRGVGIVSVEYRMYPDAKYPEFIEDAAAAVKWTIDNIGAYGGNGQIFVGGSSAGGYLSQMLCFDEKYLAKHGVSLLDITGFIHDAGQPTAHFNVLREKGIDSRRIIVDETAPLWYVGLAEKYPPMLFTWSDNDMMGRPEQLLLLLKTLEHFEYDMTTVDTMVMHGKHCHYCGMLDENGESVHGKMVFPFIAKYSNLA